MGAGERAAMRFGDGLNVQAFAAKAEDVGGPARAGRVDGSAAALACRDKRAEGPRVAAGEMQLATRAVFNSERRARALARDCGLMSSHVRPRGFRRSRGGRKSASRWSQRGRISRERR